MRVVDLSSGGLKITPDKIRKIKTSDYFSKDPIIVDFRLRDIWKTHINKTVYVRNISESHIGAEFTDSQQGDQTIGAYLLSQKHHQAIT